MDKRRRTKLCNSCTAGCCRAFRVEMPIKPLSTGQNCGWEIDWLEHQDTFPEDSDYEKTHWVPIVQPYGLDRVVFAHTNRGRVLAGIWLTCKALEGNRCSKYRERPHACFTHICEPVEEYRKTPYHTICEGKSPPAWPGMGEVHVLNMPLLPVFDNGTGPERDLERAWRAGARWGFKFGREGPSVLPIAFSGEDLPCGS